MHCLTLRFSLMSRIIWSLVLYGVWNMKNTPQTFIVKAAVVKFCLSYIDIPHSTNVWWRKTGEFRKSLVIRQPPNSNKVSCDLNCNLKCRLWPRNSFNILQSFKYLLDPNGHAVIFKNAFCSAIQANNYISPVTQSQLYAINRVYLDRLILITYVLLIQPASFTPTQVKDMCSASIIKIINGVHYKYNKISDRKFA